MEDILLFLRELCVNNNREWFDVNRSRYHETKVLVEHLTELLIAETSKIDSSLEGLQPRDCTFRIFRDTRFSNDKTPYKTNMGAYMVKGGKKSSNAGYYLHIEPDASFVAGGSYAPTSEVLLKIRQAIAADPDYFEEIIQQKSFVESFGELKGDTLKSLPRGFAKDTPGIEYIRKKQFFVVHSFSDEELLSKDFIPNVLLHFSRLKPLNDFINHAIL